ncbi:MAG: ABC transporter substrate-binding protein [Nostocoides sp.]
MNTKVQKKFVGVMASCVAALLLANCGSDSGGGSSDGGLQGEPVKLGSILTIEHPAWNNQVMKDVNAAFSKYINDELGGIDGRPVQVESCDDQGDPAKTTQCMNNLIDSGVVAFVNNSSLAFGANALPGMEKEGLANIGGWPVSGAEYSSDHEFLTSPGASGSYPSLAVFARGQGANTLAMMYSNTPSGQAASDQIEALWKQLGGGQYTGVEFDPAAPDLTPAVSRMAAAKADAVLLAVGEGAAARLFQAVKIAGVKGMVAATSAAAGAKVRAAAGDAMEGVYLSLAAVPADYDREDAKTYSKVMADNSPDTELTNQAAVAASGMMAAYDILSEISGDITKESVLKQVQATSTWKGFLVHSYDRANAPKALPAVGNPYNLVVKYSKDAFEPVSFDATGDVANYVEEDGSLTWISAGPKGS